MRDNLFNNRYILYASCLQKALFDEGCIYVGVPPLYKVHASPYLEKCPVLFPQSTIH